MCPNGKVVVFVVVLISVVVVGAVCGPFPFFDLRGFPDEVFFSRRGGGVVCATPEGRCFVWF